jgi:aminoglycoside phosphotransferase (APT) family kinase protein
MTRSPEASGTGSLPRRLEALPKVFEPVVDWLASELAGYWGRSPVEIVPVFYAERPFSHLLKAVVLAKGETSGRRIFVKIFKTTGAPDDVARMRQRVEHEFETTRAIHRAMSAWPDLGVVVPIAFDRTHLVTVTEEAAGRPLTEYLHSHARWGLRRSSAGPSITMSRIGRWIRAYQSTSPSGGSITLDELRSYIDHRLARLVTVPRANFDAADRRDVLAYIDRVGARVDPIDLQKVPIHGDLALGNILVSPDAVTVLDFAMAGTGSRLHDVTRLFVQVELMALKPPVSAIHLKEANRALLAAFDSSLTPSAPMFRLLSLLHRVNHFLTLSVVSGRFPASIYNWRVRRHHRAWIMREVRAPKGGTPEGC